MNQKELWERKHQTQYRGASFIQKENPLAKTFLEYIEPKAQILELGCGQGQDTEFFLNNGHSVVGIDISEEAIQEATQRLGKQSSVKLRQWNIINTLPFADQEFDGIYAHLSLHYTSASELDNIAKEIHRVMKVGGVFGAMVNTVEDPEYGIGRELEQDFYELPNGLQKHFFTPESFARHFNELFEMLVSDAEGHTVKDSMQGDYGLIRYIGVRNE